MMRHFVVSNQRPSVSLFILAVWTALIAGLLGAAGLLLASDLSIRATILASLYALGVAIVTGAILRSANPKQRTILSLGVAAGTAALVVLGALSFGPLLIPALLLWLLASALAWRVSQLSVAVAALALMWGFGSVLLIATIVAMAISGK